MNKQLKVIIVDTNNVWVGKGEIHEHHEQLMFNALYRSKSVNECIESSKVCNDSIEFTKHARSEFVVENHDWADEYADMFKDIDLNGIVAIRVLSKKGFMLNVDKYVICDDEELGHEGFNNYIKSFHENYTVKIENGVVHESNCPMIFY